MLRLKDNPFYILNVSLSADRKVIAEAVEEMGFLMESETVNDAQNYLMNPSKRIFAELSWFPGVQDGDIELIREEISDDKQIYMTAFTGYSELNVLLHNLWLEQHSTMYELGFDIVRIDRKYNNIDLLRTMDIINRTRKKAGIISIDENKLKACHNAIIEEIRGLLKEKLKTYDEPTYIEFVTVVAEQYVADTRYKAGPILFDIIDQYEIQMQSEIETKADKIIQYIDLIKEEPSENIIKKSIPKVVSKVEDWGTIAKPLQLRSKATGLPHMLSRKLAYAIRDLIIFLNNDKYMTGEARDLAYAMKTSFLELGEFNELFSKDTETLQQIEKDNESTIITKTIENLLVALENDNKYLLYTGDAIKIKAYCDQVVLINNAIKDGNLDDQKVYQLRTRLCFSARNAILSKDHKEIDPFDSKYVLIMLYDLFQDIPYLKQKLQSDLAVNK